MNDWDPMMADYNDTYFNRYSQGVGRNLLSGNMGTAHIFVDYFPVDLGEEGLVNLFSDFGNVLSADLKPSNREDKRHTFGFVVMSNPTSAAEAISALNGHKFPFSSCTLKVHPAVTNEEKGRRRMNKQIERDIMGPYAGIDTFSHPDERNRVPLEYRFPNLRNFPSPGYPVGNMNFSGPQMLPLGRGRMRNNMGPSAVGSPLGGGRGQRLHEYISHGPVRGSLRPPSNKEPPRVSQASSRKHCIFCLQEDSTNRCSRCKMFYCSTECQRKDWPNHRNICLDVSLHHETLYGADPFETMSISSRESQSNAPRGASSRRDGGNQKNEHRKDIDLPGKRNKPCAKEEKGQKNQSSSRGPGNKPRGQSSESVPVSVKRDNSNLKQNVQTNKSNASSSSQSDKENKQSVQSRQQTKNAEETKNTQHTRNAKETRVQSSQQPRNAEETRAQSSQQTTNAKETRVQSSQQSRNAEETMNKDNANIQKKKNNKGRGKDSPKNQSKSPLKMEGKQNEEGTSSSKTEPEKRNDREIVEQKSGRANNVDASGDAPTDLECDSLPLNSQVECFLSYYDNPDMFWVIKKENMVPFLEATQIFTECIKDVPDIVMKDVKAGDLCCLLYCGEWSRAWVVKVHNSKATVIFPDYGNKEDVDVSDLKPLVPEMKQLPIQAIRCCLADSKPKKQYSESANAAVKNWLGEPLTKELIVTCQARTMNRFLVDIACESASPTRLEELLLTENEIVKRGNDNEKVKDVKQTPKLYQPKDLQSIGSELGIGQQVNINIMVFKNVGNFVGQVLDKLTALPRLEEVLEKLNLDHGDPYRPVVGELVLAKFDVDNRWYRSEVTAIDRDTYNVTYLDYGNEQSVTSKDIRPFHHASLLEFPRYAVSFAFHGIDLLTPSEEMLNEFASLLEEYTVDPGVWRVVILERKNSIFMVDFHSETKTQSLSEALFKKLSPKKNSPQKTVASPPAASVSPVVTSKSSPLAVTPKKSPPSAVTSKKSPPSAVTPKTPPSTVTPKSPPLTVNPKNPPLNFSTHKKRDTEEIPTQDLCLICTESLPGSTTNMASVIVFYVVNLEHFYVGLGENQVSLNEMMLELNTNVDNIKCLEKAQKGSVATVKFEDGLWYRVRVTSIEGETCSVFFMDYGNTETVKTDGLHIIPDLVSTNPAQAIHCSLDVQSGQFHPDTLKQLKLLEETNVHVKVLRKEKDLFVVQVCKPDGSSFLQAEKNNEAQKLKISTAPTPMLCDIEVKEPTDKEMDVHCAHFKTVNEFYCLKVEDILGVTDLSGNLASFYEETLEPGVYQEPIIGGLYGCYFENQWYRCAVEEIKDYKSVLIKYIDFGNTETRDITDLKPLDHEYLFLPVSLFKCKLHGIQVLEDDKNSIEIIEKYNLMLQEKLQFHESHVKIEGKEGDIFLVSLSLTSTTGQRVDIASDLVSVSLARRIEDPQPQQQVMEDMQEDEEEDEDERKMRELMRQMEEIKMRKKNKTAK